MKKFILLTIMFSGCSSANMSAVDSWGKNHHIQCFSGEKLIYDGISTGKIENEKNSDGYYFQDKSTGKIVIVSGNCLITLE